VLTVVDRPAFIERLLRIALWSSIGSRTEKHRRSRKAVQTDTHTATKARGYGMAPIGKARGQRIARSIERQPARRDPRLLGGGLARPAFSARPAVIERLHRKTRSHGKTPVNRKSSSEGPRSWNYPR
jgi:hypothetical protein